MDKKLFTFDEIKLKIANYCAYQERCHSEVEHKMREFVLIPEAKDEIFLYLIKENYLNEERFTRSYIRGKFYIKNWGRNKIKQHLRMKSVSDKLVQKCMNEIDDSDYEIVMKKIWDSYYEKQKGLKEYQKKSKTIKYLMSKGYEYEVLMKMFQDF